MTIAGLAIELTLVLLWLRLVFWTVMAVRYYRGASRMGGADGARGHVSVVIPAWNEAGQIAATLRSLGHQTQAPFEVIVVDDGSEDTTAEIAQDALAKVADGQLLRLPQNVGKAQALNAGIAQATGRFVLTLDADTRLAPDALDRVVGALCQDKADACALHVAVEEPRQFLQRMQAHEYAAALNFERAGQARLGAISILPGAATLFRRAALGRDPFVARTLTEDADKTLELLTQGSHLKLAERALAYTDAPVHFGGLLRQRGRWMAGHLQCVAWHRRSGKGARVGARLGLVNFGVTTLAPVLAACAFVMLVVVGGTPILGLDWLSATLTASGLTYGQRCVALWTDPRGWQGWSTFVAEPPFTGLLHLLSFGAGLWRLLCGNRRWRARV